MFTKELLPNYSNKLLGMSICIGVSGFLFYSYYNIIVSINKLKKTNKKIKKKIKELQRQL